MVLDKRPVPGRPTDSDYSMARAYCACSRLVRLEVVLGIFFYHFSLLSPSLWERVRYRLKYCLKGPLSPNQPTNQMAMCRGKFRYIRSKYYEWTQTRGPYLFTFPHIGQSDHLDFDTPPNERPSQMCSTSGLCREEFV